MLRACLAVVSFLSATMSGVTVVLPSCRMAAVSSVTWTFPSISQFRLTLRGAGLDASVITWTGSNGIALNLTQQGHSFHIQDMTIATASAGTYVGFRATQSIALGTLPPSGLTRVSFRGIDLSHYWDTQCQMTGVSNVNFVECQSVGGSISSVQYGNGIVCQGTSSVTAVVANFTDCNFVYLHEAITYGDYFQGMSLSGTNITVCTNGICQHAGSGATVIGAQLSMNGCQINCYSNGVLLEGHIADVLISGANLFYGDLVAGGACIFFTNTSSVLRASITGNGFESANLGDAVAIAGALASVTINSNYMYAFVSGVYAISGSTITYGTINDNTIQGLYTTAFGINLAGTDTALSIDGNMFAVLSVGVNLGANTTWCKGVNTYSNCTTPVSDSGISNTVT